MTRFRPCIDLHAGQVKQIVGGTLTTPSPSTLNADATPNTLKTNYVSALPASHFANLYKEHNLTGAHVIMLGPGNEDVAREALAAWPGGLQVGGGITDANSAEWIERGAEKVRQLEKRFIRHERPPPATFASLPHSVLPVLEASPPINLRTKES